MNADKAIPWTKEDVGCMSDGSYGTDHHMRKLAWLLQSTLPSKDGITLYPSNEDGEIYDVLRSGDTSKLSDDHSELDRAVDMLNEWTEEDISFAFVDGDLLLIEDSEVE